MEIAANATNVTKLVSGSILDGDAQEILSEAAKDIPLDVWKAIALAEQMEPPVQTPTFIYTSTGTMGI